MVPRNALSQHRILKEKLEGAEKLATHSRFNVLEDNGKEIGIIGSGIGYYYTRSILNPKEFSWLKLGFVHPFPTELVKKFASKVKKIIVVEELRPFIESNARFLHGDVLGKVQTGLEEIGEFTPDTVRDAFAKLGFFDKAEERKDIALPARPPLLCPGCPHRAFYYSLNAVSQFVNCHPQRCTGCDICEYICSCEKEGVFNPVKSRIRTVRLNTLPNTALTCRTCQSAPFGDA